jgi:hypothetical protein
MTAQKLDQAKAEAFAENMGVGEQRNRKLP